MTTCQGCNKDTEQVGTHWGGCHEVHPQCAAYHEGWRAGMRAAAEIVHEVYFKGVPEKHILDAILSEADK